MNGQHALHQRRVNYFNKIITCVVQINLAILQRAHCDVVRMQCNDVTLLIERYVLEFSQWYHAISKCQDGASCQGVSNQADFDDLKSDQDSKKDQFSKNGNVGKLAIDNKNEGRPFTTQKAVFT